MKALRIWQSIGPLARGRQAKCMRVRGNAMLGLNKGPARDPLEAFGKVRILLPEDHGTERKKLVREARNAWRAMVAALAGGVPASVPRMIFLLFGQMMPQTLNSITMPKPPPTPMERT